MSRYDDWTVADLYWKMDSEGGIWSIINWGGPEVFTCLGEEAVEMARTIEADMNRLYAMFDAHQDEIEAAAEDW